MDLEHESGETVKGVEKAFAALDAYVKRKMDFGSIPGLALAVTSREDLLGSRYYGCSDLESQVVPTNETLFEIGSIGKSFASAVVLQLAEEGLVNLKRPVDEYLPWLEAKWKGEKFSMHHLMSHTAGLPLGSDATPEAISEVWTLRDMELGCSPGEFFHYSNIGYKIVGLVIEKMTGMSCAEAIKRRILVPLGMNRSHAAITQDLRPFLAVPYEPSLDDRPPRRGSKMVRAPWTESDSADGSICSTPEDMAAYVRMLLNRGNGPRVRILSDDAFRLLTQPAIAVGGDPGGRLYAYGLNVERSDGHTLLGHTGGMVGYVSAMRLDAGTGLGVVVLTNGATDVDDVAVYALKAFEAAGSKVGEPPRELPYTLPSTVLNDYAGVYSSSAGSVEVKADGSGGLLLVTQSRSEPLEPREKDVFIASMPGFDMYFMRFVQRDGQVTEVRYGGDVYFRDGKGTLMPPPESCGAYCGHFRSCNPWLTNFRVLARNGALWMFQPSGEESELVSLGQDVFRIGADERSPERVRFYAIVNSKAYRADICGQTYARTAVP